MVKGKKSNKQVKLIVQALSSAEASIALAKQLLSDYSGVEIAGASAEKIESSVKDLPGIVGTFEGTFLVDEKGVKHQVPANYASKSRLVYGDTLKLVQTGGRDVFKQLKKVPRRSVTGILGKKGEDWVVATGDGSYRVLTAAVRYYEGQEGEEVAISIPEGNPQAPFAAIDSFPGKEKEGGEGESAVDQGRSARPREKEIQQVDSPEPPSPPAAPPETTLAAASGTILLGEDELR